MNSIRHLKTAVWRWSLGLLMVLHLGGCVGCGRPSCGSVYLISPSESLAALQRGDLAEARRILEPRLAAKPADAELSYTLGCVYLLLSDAATDTKERENLRSRGWQRVEAASARSFAAETLLAHAYLSGRWGKKRSQARHLEHNRRVDEIYKAQHLETKMDELHRRTWAYLTADEIIYNQGGRLFRRTSQPVSRESQKDADF